MTKIKQNDQFNELGEQAKSLIEKGNARHVILRNEDGSKIVDMSLTVAIVIGAVLLFMPWNWVIIAVAAIYGIVKKIRVEIVRDLTDEDDAIEVDLDK